MSFNSKWFISDIHWISTGGKPNPIGFGAPNPKTVGEKPSLNPNPQNPKPVDIHLKSDPLQSLNGWQAGRHDSPSPAFFSFLLPYSCPPSRVQHLTIKDGNGSGLGRISVGFGFCGFGFGMVFHPRFSGSGPRNQSGSVLGFVFHPWISNWYPK